MLSPKEDKPTLKMQMFLELDPKHYTYGWFKSDKVESMRNAIIIRLAQHLIGCDCVESAKTYQRFLDNVLAGLVTVTKNKSLEGLVIAASQMVDKSSWENRQELIEKFIIVYKE